MDYCVAEKGKCVARAWWQLEPGSLVVASLAFVSIFLGLMIQLIGFMDTGSSRNVALRKSKNSVQTWVGAHPRTDVYGWDWGWERADYIVQMGQGHF